MKKIKILFFSHTIDYGGTWRSHERILLNLNKDLFEPYVLYNPKKNNNRLNYLKTKLNKNNIIPYFASDDKLGANVGYPYIETNFSEICHSIGFDIIHFARSGYFEWPFNQRLSNIQIETNIFGGRDNSEYLDYSVTICNTINNLRRGSDKVLYNPIPPKINDDKNLKKELSIDDDYIVFGRIGRKANFHPISFESLSEFKKTGKKFKYIIIGACNNAIKTINKLGLENDCIIIETTNDDYLIHKFYNTIDLFLHYRSDGECHSTAISQSLMYGKPVISHYGGFNGQSETISNGGYVAKNNKEYYDKISELVGSKSLYDLISKNAILRSKDFELKKIVSDWEHIYINLFKQK